MIDRIDYLRDVAEGKGCPISDCRRSRAIEHAS